MSGRVDHGLPRLAWRDGGAAIEGPYRYRLWREWTPALPRCCFVMLNPSTADGQQDDPTVRRCLGFAKDWGYGRLDVVNLYAWRATDPRELARVPDPVGPVNDLAIVDAARGAGVVVAAWGAAGPRHVGRRTEQVLALLACIGPVHSLGFTALGQPRHPLFARGDRAPDLWRGRYGAHA